MQTELEEHLASGDKSNHKNGTISTTMKSPAGSFELQAPRVRAGTFESQIVKRHQAQLSDELERKITALLTLGNSYQNIRTHITDTCGMELSNGTNNTVTNKLCLGLKPGVSVIWRLFTQSSSSTLFIL